MAKPLEAYRAKRDFRATPEPSGLEGRRIKPSEHLRFVVQKHDATRLHYDLRLEIGGVFKSWAVTRGPSLDPAEKRLAVEVEEHPLAYGDFEGTIPEGEYGGGTVMIWDRGFWAPESSVAPEVSLAEGELKFVLAGHKLQGSWVLIRLKPRAGDKRPSWLLIKHRDRWATRGQDDVLARDRSVASGRAMQTIRNGRGKAPAPFMTSGDEVPASASWTAAASERLRRRTASERAEQRPSVVATMPRLTNRDRVLWPDPPVTKRELAEYLIGAAPWMMEHLYGRPCSLIRAPDGIEAETFFQRHAMPGQSAGIKTVTIDREHEAYIQIDDAQSLVALAQFSVVELHPWNCAPYAPDVPGRLVLDLDPADDVPFDQVVEAALEMRRRVEALGLVAFCKTTGGKGLHVVVPLIPDEATNWDQAKLFAQTLAAQMAADKPARYLTRMTKSARTGRIYLDYLRNDAKATAVAPLSPRARPGAPVSMPLNWTQVRKGLDPKRFTMRTALPLLQKSKPWTGYRQAARSLSAAVTRLVGDRA